MTIYRRILTILAVFVLVCASVSTSAAAVPERISIAYSKDLAPFHFSDENGQPAGIIIDLWRLWSEKTGVAIDLQAADWNETLTMVGSGAADVHAGLFFNEARDKFLDYGSAFTKMETHYFYHVSLPQIKKISALAAYRVGVIDGDYAEKYLQERLPRGTLVSFANFDAMMNALQKGTLKVFAADTLPGLFYLKKNGLLSEFAFVSEKPLYQNKLFFAVQEGNRALIETINRGLALITEDEKREINRRWYTSGEKKGKALVVGIDRDYAPFTFVNTLGKPAGLFVDMWREWAQKDGRKIQFRPSNWTETIENLRIGEIDIHSGLSFSDERAEWIGFSNSIYETHTRMYHLIGDDQPTTIGNYGADKIGVMSGSYQEAEFKKIYPKLKIQSYTSNQELVDALLKKEIKALVEEEQILDHFLDKLGLRGNIVARPEKLFPSMIHAGILKGNTELLQQIKGGFTAISEDKLSEIEKRWITNPEMHFYHTEKKITLSAKEQAWINANPVVRVHNEKEWAPYNFSENGNPRGFSIDYMNLLASKIGIKIEYITGPTWSEFMKMIRTKELDVMLNIAVSPERQKFLAFTHSYVKLTQALFTRDEYPMVSSIKDLYGKTFAIPKGFYLQEILKTHSEIKILEVADTTEAIRAVSFGKADAMFDIMPVVSLKKSQLQINNIKVGGVIEIVDSKPIPLHIGVRKEDNILAGILNKAMDAIASEELKVLNQRWLSITAGSQKHDLSKILSGREIKWLLKQNAFKLGIDPTWRPFEFIDEKGKYSGISSSYVEAVENRIQVEMNPVFGLSWTQMLEKAKNREIDVIPAIARSSEREKYLHFSKPYLSLPIIIAANRNMPYFNSLNDLNGYRVGVIKNYVTDEMLSKDYSDLNLNRYPTLAAGLKDLNAGKLDAFVDNLSAITYEITEFNFNDIKISAPTEYKFELAFGVRKDWPELAGILTKVIDDIGDKEKLLIKNTWIAPVEVKYGIDIRRILMWAVPVVLSGIMILVFVFIWNRRLSNEIIERTNKEKLIVLSGKINQSLTAVDSLKETLQSISDTFVAELNVAFSRIWIVDETGNQLKLQASSGLHTHIKGDHELLPIGGETKIGRVVAEKHPQVSNSILESPYIKDKDWAREQKLKSFAGIPMVVEGRAVGALVVFSRETIREDVVNTILSVSDSIAVAIERNRAEETALASERKIRAMSDSSLDALVMIDGKANIIFWNPAAERIFGYSAEEVMGRNLHELIATPEDREFAGKGVADFSGSGEGKVIGVVIERTGRRKDGSTFPAEIAVSALQMENEWYAVGTVRDISDRKQVEEELQQHLSDLKQFEKVAIGREERMIDLKEEINTLLEQTGKVEKYKIV
ncbi:transporter substrate-binding domain-containing protein [Thermodesulfobacteriota bacterium]